MIGKVIVKISYDRRSSVAALLAVAVLVAVFLGYLALRPRDAAASPHVPAAARAVRSTTTGLRQYYLTDDNHIGSQPTTACATGYHMASLWEILDPSNLRYNVNLGEDRLDAGMGPPSAMPGWIRTGYGADAGTTMGQANCNAWTSSSAGHHGTMVHLPEDWQDASRQVISVWDVGLGECDTGWNVWCVADAVDGPGTCAIPQPIACGQQVSGNTTGRASHIGLYDCVGWNEAGPEMIYRLDLPMTLAPYTVTATLSGLSADLDVFILPAGGCYQGQCLAYGDESASATSLSGGAYYIAVDGYNGAAGSYTLSIDCGYSTVYRVYIPLVLRH